LIELVKTGTSREKAYRLVQKHAMAAWKENKDFKEGLLQDKEIAQALKPYKIKRCFELDYYLRNVNNIFKRAGLSPQKQ